VNTQISYTPESGRSALAWAKRLANPATQTYAALLIKARAAGKPDPQDPPYLCADTLRTVFVEVGRRLVLSELVGSCCAQCGVFMNPVGKMLGRVCGKCCRANHKAAVGRS
jgi:hypothetical protein